MAEFTIEKSPVSLKYANLQTILITSLGPLVTLKSAFLPPDERVVRFWEIFPLSSPYEDKEASDQR